MAIIYSTAVKNSRLQAVVNALGTGGLLVIGTSALSGATGVLATEALGNPAGSVSNGVLTLSGTPLTVAASGTGTAAKAELRDSANNVIASGLTVGTSAADIILDSVNITAGQNVTINSGTITHG